MFPVRPYRNYHCSFPTERGARTGPRLESSRSIPYYLNSMPAGGRSSNGRTGGSGPPNRGSNPCLPANFLSLSLSTPVRKYGNVCGWGFRVMISQ